MTVDEALKYVISMGVAIPKNPGRRSNLAPAALPQQKAVNQ